MNIHVRMFSTLCSMFEHSAVVNVILVKHNAIMFSTLCSMFEHSAVVNEILVEHNAIMSGTLCRVRYVLCSDIALSLMRY